MIVHNGSHAWVGPLTQSHSLREGSCCDTSKHLPQQCFAWNPALLACWHKASAVGGTRSLSLALRVKRFPRASFTDVHELVQSYRWRTGRASVTTVLRLRKRLSLHRISPMYPTLSSCLCFDFVGKWGRLFRPGEGVERKESSWFLLTHARGIVVYWYITQMLSNS